MKAMYIPTEDGYLFCKTSGKGKPLLLLHGSEENHEIFKYQVPYFNQTYHVIALDSRGHGRSDHGRTPLSFEKMAKDILSVLDYLKLERVSIIGFSDGGNLALYLASHYPAKVEKMVLVGANFKANGLRKKDFLFVQCHYYYLNKLGKYSERQRKRKEIIDLMWHQLDLTKEDLKKITIPTLIVAGEQDVIKPQHTEQMHQLINTSQKIIFPAATHFLMLEKPAAFNSMAARFFTANK